MMDFTRNPTDDSLRALGEFARSRHIPAMLPECAMLLRQTVMLSRPKKILEIGTGNGFSGICMLLSAPGARLYTIEHNESRAEEAKENFRAAGVLDRVTVFTGDVYEILPYVSGSFDFVFFDGPKAHYKEFFAQIREYIAPGGVLYCDNVLFRGYVRGEKEYVHRMNTIVKNMREFLRILCEDKEFTTGVYDIGDGVSVSIRQRHED